MLAELYPKEPLRLLRLDSAEEVQLSDAVTERLPQARALVHVMLLEEPVRPAELGVHLDPSALAALVELGLLVEESGRLRTDGYRIVPFEGLLLVASALAARPAGGLEPGRRVPSVYLGAD